MLNESEIRAFRERCLTARDLSMPWDHESAYLSGAADALEFALDGVGDLPPDLNPADLVYTMKRRT